MTKADIEKRCKEKDGLWAVLKEKDRLLTPYIYKEVKFCGDQLTLGANNERVFKEKDELWAVFTEDGQQLTPYIYVSIKPYENGVAVGKIHIDNIENKEFVTEAKHYDATEQAIIFAGEDCYQGQVECFIDLEGNVLNNYYFKDIAPISIEQYYEMADANRNYHILTPDHKFVFANFDFVYVQFIGEEIVRHMFQDGLAKVSLRYPEDTETYGYVCRYGFVNEQLEWVVDAKYHHLTEFVDGYAKFYQHDAENCYKFTAGYIDKKGAEYRPHVHDDHVYFSTEDGTIGKLKTYCNFYDVKEIFAHQFENGKYGFIAPDGKILIEGVYDETPPILWGGIGFACKDDKWAIIDEQGKLASDYEYDAIGYVGRQYVCARQGEITYLIGKKGVIHKKKNGFYGYKYRIENYKTKEKRYSCGTHLYFNFNKVDAFKGYHDKRWVGVDEFDKSFRGIEYGFNKQFPAEYTSHYNHLEHHEPSDTYYFVIGNKYGVDIHGKQIVLADLKEELSDVDITKYVESFKAIYGDMEIPAIWLDLVKHGWVWERPKEGYADCSFSRSIRIRCADELDAELLDTYAESDAKIESIRKQFYFLAQADGTGGSYHYYLVNKDLPLEENPIVFFGSEGEINVVANNLRDFLQILVADAEIMGSDIFDSDEIPDFSKEDSENDTTYLEDYKQWLEKQDIKRSSTKKEIKDLLKAAKKQYGAKLKAYMESIIE